MLSIDWKGAFDIIKNALGVISAAGHTPGVNLIPYVSTIAAAADAISAGIEIGAKVLPYALDVKETFANGLPSASKLAALDARIAELRAIVQAPLPPAEEGEPA